MTLLKIVATVGKKTAKELIEQAETVELVGGYFEIRCGELQLTLTETNHMAVRYGATAMYRMELTGEEVLALEALEEAVEDRYRDYLK